MRDLIMSASTISPATAWHGVRYEKRPILLIEILISISTFYINPADDS